MAKLSLSVKLGDSDDFMCVHFIPRTADKATWSSQTIFWSEAISLYAHQLLFECPFKINRLTFTASDITKAHTRKNRLSPLCIVDIIKFMKYKKNHILLASFLDKNYEKNAKNEEKYDGNSSLLSISGVSSMVHSMFGFFNNMDSDDEEEDDDHLFEHKNDGNEINENMEVLYTPILDELCDRMSHLNFYKKAINDHLSQLVEIGIINVSKTGNKDNEFIINGLVFYRFCAEILNLTNSDILLMKKYLIYKGKIKLFYLNDDELNDFTTEQIEKSFTTKIEHGENRNDNDKFHDLKNEMIFFYDSCKEPEITKDHLTKMQLLSIQITMKHLKFQKCENEENLNNLNNELLEKLKFVPTAKRKQFMESNKVLLKRKKLLKNRISTLDGSIYNLESTLHSISDMTINKMVFNEMKNADKMLKNMIKSTPSIQEIESIKEDIQESMEINNEIGDVLSKQMTVDGMDENDENDEILKEYQELEMQNAKESLPDAPNHDIVINDQVVHDQKELIDKDKKVLIN